MKHSVYFVIAGSVIMAAGYVALSGPLFSFGAGMFVSAALEPLLHSPREDRQ